MKILRSYQANIFLGFLSVVFIILCWFLFNLRIEQKIKNQDHLSGEVNRMITDYLLNSRHLPNFLLTGFQQTEFYTTHEQKDIDAFETYLESNFAKIATIDRTITNHHSALKKRLVTLQEENALLLQLIRELKTVYTRRGFKDYGAEGEMRSFAHQLEDLALLPKNELLQLRRHEKDFLLRGQTEYAKAFDSLITQLMRQNATHKKTYDLLAGYKKNFDLLVAYNNQIGLTSPEGLYQRIQSQGAVLLQSYLNLIHSTQAITNSEKAHYRLLLYTGSAVLVTLVFLTAWRLSKYLTKEIKALNQIMLHYIHSGFKAGKIAGLYQPKILEVEILHRSFHLLRKKLDHMLIEKINQHHLLMDAVLKGQEKERKNIGAELHDNINPMLATARLYLTAKTQDDDHRKDMIAEATKIIDKSIFEVRKLSHSLVAAHTDTINLKDSLGDLFFTIEAGARLKINFTLYNFDECRLSEDQKLAIYRIAQEQLINIIKHAKAENVSVVLREKEGILYFIIKDDGAGFDTTQKTQGIGFRNIEARLEVLNGKMFIHSSPGKGCEMAVFLPL